MTPNVKDINKFSPAKRALFEILLRKKGILLTKIQPISRGGGEVSIPLSYSQQRLWFLAQMDPDSPVYTVRSIRRITGNLNVETLRKCLQTIVERHETLRSIFSTETPSVDFISYQIELPIVDLQNIPPNERLTEAEKRAANELNRPFDLERGPLFRVRLFRLRSDDHILTLYMHHIISDGWSIGVLFQELALLYDAALKNQTPNLPQLPIQYSDYAAWELSWLKGDLYQQQLAFWTRQLKDVPALEFPLDRSRPPTQTYRGNRLLLSLTPELTNRLRILSQRTGTTLFIVLLTGFCLILHRYSGQDDLVIGSPVANRNRKSLEGMVGLFLNMLALRVNLSGNPSFFEALSHVQKVVTDALENKDIPFEKLLEELNPKRDLSQTPIFQILFNMLNLDYGQRLRFDGITIEEIQLSHVNSKFDFTIYIYDTKEQLEFNVVYNSDLFDKTRIAEMMGQYRYLLEQIVDNPTGKITDYSLVTPAAQEILPDPTARLGDEWHGAIHHQFTRQARQNPQQISVSDHRDSWTYQELDRRGNQLAHYLIRKGVKKGDVVAIYADRSASLVWAILGILKSGGAFTILDPLYPEERLINYLRAAQPRAFLRIETAGDSRSKVIDFLSNECPRVIIPTKSAVKSHFLCEEPDHDPDVALCADDPAYISFTSGSTGKPKGILGRHGSLTHFMPWQEQNFHLQPADRFSMLSGLSHDPLQRDIFTALWAGASIHIPDPENILAPGWLADWLINEQITISHLTPALAHIVADPIDKNKSQKQSLGMRLVFYLGDKLMRHDVLQMRSYAPNATIVNCYGSTETQRSIGYYQVPPEVLHNKLRALIPLGTGIPDTQMLVINKNFQLAGIGEFGEIYIRSPHLALGYVDDDALTQQSFIGNPYFITSGEIPGDRMYKTGDMGRYLPDGTVEFAGRTDNQVQIRGFRIELGEIESILSQHPAIKESVIIVNEDPSGDKRLAAYFIPTGDSSPFDFESHELREYLKKKAPDYMIPSFFLPLEKFPLTPNGKIDRRSMPTPDLTQLESDDQFVSPRNPIEEVLADIWADVLGLKKVGVKDNFFDLGGHSLKMTRIASRLKNIFQLSLPLRQLFESPTIAELAVDIKLALSRTQGETCPNFEKSTVSALMEFIQISRISSQRFTDGSTVDNRGNREEGEF
ncbi:MAG: hypothetical protein B6244_04180 [Candidatus Cloacimonetes bacterium 4572_55]|nr:MAG: hypothetical protein B6244_04180 [Candidatus Cloacimonetes bacterium 4572_55]